MQQCDWSDCLVPIKHERVRSTDASNWQSALAVRSAEDYTRQARSRAAMDPHRKIHPICTKKNPKAARAKSTREKCGGVPYGAAYQEPTREELKLDCEEEYWKVAELLGLVRPT